MNNCQCWKRNNKELKIPFIRKFKDDSLKDILMETIETMSDPIMAYSIGGNLKEN